MIPLADPVAVEEADSQREAATGYGPCRHCLRAFFTYDPFAGVEPLPLPSSVFIHEERCERSPADGGFPDDLRPHALTLNAYRGGRKLLAQEYVTGPAVETVIGELFARPEIDYIHVRDTRRGLLRAVHLACSRGGN